MIIRIIYLKINEPNNIMETKYETFDEIGIDEAGRGPLIGRVYAGAVIWSEDLKECPLIKDSKKLSAKKRKLALEWIKSNIKHWAVGYAEHDEIDKLNILNATALAMKRAVKNLNLDTTHYDLIIDGTNWCKKFPEYSVNSVVDGDNKYYSIACASIIAKEYHDEYIKELCEKNPDLDTKYGLSKNMGYGTKVHLEGIKKHGISQYHRKSFKTCK
jgi:ribonuclease HII